MSERPIEIALLGDIILDVPEPDHWLSGIAPLTRAADCTIAHLEVPHTLHGEEVPGDIPAPGADPAHLAALARAGIDAVSLAGNHMGDCGPVGIADTIAELDRLGIAHAGAGASLQDALAPAFLQVGDAVIGLLSFNCVGPELSWAAADRAGCAYVIVRPPDGGASSPQIALETIDPRSLEAMQETIADARRRCDLLVVALHKGITHRPAALAPYERPIAAAAVAAGADVIAGHHAHIARGIEMIGDRPVFHGLGNGVVVTHALSPAQDHPARAEWVERRKRLFGFEPDPAYPIAPFHPEAVDGMIGRIRRHPDGRIEAGFTPTWSEPPGRPILPEAAQAERIAGYVDAIGRKAGLSRLPAEMHWPPITA